MVARAKSVRDRALAAKLFAPLRDRVAENDELPPDEWEGVWTTEIERRVAEVRAGKVKRIPAKIVIEEALPLARRSGR